MFGKIIKKYCPNCKKDVSCSVSQAYIVNNIEYYPYCCCGKCLTDLGEKDREILNKAIEENKKINRAFY